MGPEGMKSGTLAFARNTRPKLGIDLLQFIADLLHRLGEEAADLLVSVGRNRADLGGHLERRDFQLRPLKGAFDAKH
jgi:hypothetical protein